MVSDSHHIREIEHVSQGRGVGRDPIVVASWLRCLNEYGLDPTARAAAHIVTDRELREHRQRTEDLVNIARSGIERLYSLVAGQNYVLLLANRAGVTVEYLGDEAQKAALRKGGLYLGAEWSEARAGTCAVGACLESGEALIIHQTDHFDVTHGGLSCTAAPVYDTRGGLVATLDISLLSSPQPRASQSMALNLVQQAVRRIEMANIMAESRREWVLRLAGSPDFLDVDPEAALSLDGSGRVIGMTHGAARLMARAVGADWRRADLLVGRMVSDFFDIRLDRLGKLTRHQNAADRFIETRDGHRLFAHAIEPRRVEARRVPMREPIAPHPAVPQVLRDLAGDDPGMGMILARAAALAPRKMPILIEGETGSGKLTLARAIHEAGRRGKLTVLPCAGLSDADDALVFGRSQGHNHEPGLLEQAGPGTLVIDKIGELPPRLQARLLQLASEGSFLPVGALKPVTPDLRLIVTAQDDLGQAVQQGRFRRDLYHSLAGATLSMPPLRERRDLFWLFDRLLRAAFGQAVTIAPEVPVRLAAYRWPGNLRELSRLAETLAAVLTLPQVELWDLPDQMKGADTAASDNVHQLAQLLQETGGNVSECARRLGVDRTTIHRRMRRLGLNRRG